MIIQQLYSFLSLLSLCSSNDLLKLIAVYSNESDTRKVSEIEQQSNRIGYVAALATLFSRSESTVDIECQIQQLKRGIKKTCLYSEAGLNIIKLNLEQSMQSPYSNWFHKYDAINYLVLMSHPKKMAHRSAEVKLALQHISNRVPSFNVEARKRRFFSQHTSDYWNTHEHNEQNEVRILMPYFNQSEIERVKMLAFALHNKGNIYFACTAKGLDFLDAIFYRLDVAQIRQVKALVLDLASTQSSCRDDTMLAPLYKLIIMLAPTFDDIDVGVAVNLFLDTAHDFNLDNSPLNLLKIVLEKMSDVQIQSIASIIIKKIHDNCYTKSLNYRVLTILFPYLTEIQIQDVKILAMQAYASSNLTGEGQELLAQIVPYCNATERTKIRNIVQYSEEYALHYLRLVYVLCSGAERKKLNDVLINNINKFDSDFKYTDRFLFEDLLANFTDEQVTQIITTALLAYIEAPTQAVDTIQTTAKNSLFTLLAPRLTILHTERIMNVLLFTLIDSSSIDMRRQVLNTISLLMVLNCNNFFQESVEKLPKAYGYCLLQSFYQQLNVHRKIENQSVCLTSIERKKITILSKLNAYIQRIEEPKVEYWSKRYNCSATIDFQHGFWFARKNRSAKREANFKLACAFRKQIYTHPTKPIETIINEEPLLLNCKVNASLREIISFANAGASMGVS